MEKGYRDNAKATFKLYAKARQRNLPERSSKGFLTLSR